MMPSEKLLAIFIILTWIVLPVRSDAVRAMETPAATATCTSTPEAEFTSTPTPVIPAVTPSPAGSPSPAPSAPTATATPYSTPTPMLDPPELLYPECDARFGCDSVPFAFSWRCDKDHGVFEMQIAVNSEFDDAVSMFLTDCTYHLDQVIRQEDWTPLEFTAWWRVRIVDDSKIPLSGWSSSRQFTKTVQCAPEIESPFNDARFGENQSAPEFRWREVEGVTSYVLAFYSEASSETYLGELTTTDCSIDLSTIIPADVWSPLVTRLYFRVSGVNTLGLGTPWSAFRYFTKTTLAEPEVVYPGSGYHFPPESSVPRLEWTSVAGADHYQIGFSADNFFLGEEIILETPRNYFDLRDSMEDWYWNTLFFTVYWRIAAVDANGFPGPWSGVSSFTKNGRNRYMAYGDSITGGWGSHYTHDGVNYGYPVYLEDKLKAEVNPEIEVESWWIPGGKSWQGEDRLPLAMKEICPEFVLVMIGIVDFVDPNACDPPFDCRTAEHLENICYEVLDRNATPIIATITPPNPDGAAAELDGEVCEVNDQIREFADAHGFMLADVYDAFQEAADGDLSRLFFDWLHPNELGYQVMSQCWFEAITAHR